MGRPLSEDGLRARVSSWPPLRLARMRRERGSVGVVVPTCLPYRQTREGKAVTSSSRWRGW